MKINILIKNWTAKIKFFFESYTKLIIIGFILSIVTFSLVSLISVNEYSIISTLLPEGNMPVGSSNVSSGGGLSTSTVDLIKTGGIIGATLGFAKIVVSAPLPTNPVVAGAKMLVSAATFIGGVTVIGKTMGDGQGAKEVIKEEVSTFFGLSTQKKITVPANTHERLEEGFNGLKENFELKNADKIMETLRKEKMVVDANLWGDKLGAESEKFCNTLPPHLKVEYLLDYNNYLENIRFNDSNKSSWFTPDKKVEHPLSTPKWTEKMSSIHSSNTVENHFVGVNGPIDNNEFNKAVEYIDSYHFAFYHDEDYIMANTITDLFLATPADKIVYYNTLLTSDINPESIPNFEAHGLIEFLTWWLSTPLDGGPAELLMLDNIFLVALTLTNAYFLALLFILQNFSIYLNKNPDLKYFKYKYLGFFLNRLKNFSFSTRFCMAFGLITIVQIIFWRGEVYGILMVLFNICIMKGSIVLPS